MKRNILLLLVVAALSVVVISCRKDECIMYGAQDFCDVVEGTLHTDEGCIYHVTTNSSGNEIGDLSRVFIRCNVIRKTPSATSANEYDIDLLDFAPVLKKSPLVLSGLDESVVGNDPVNLSQGWITGVDSLHVNIYFEISFLKDSKTSHLMNVVYDDVKSNSDTLFFQLRHNGYGEVYGSGKVDDANVELGGGYMSFNVEEFIPERSGRLVLSFSYPWYKQTGGFYTTAVETKVTNALLEFDAD